MKANFYCSTLADDPGFWSPIITSTGDPSDNPDHAQYIANEAISLFFAIRRGDDLYVTATRPNLNERFETIPSHLLKDMGAKIDQLEETNDLHR